MKISFCLFIFVVFVSCTIQKRTVNKGYFVQWHFANRKVQKIDYLNQNCKDTIQLLSDKEDFKESQNSNFDAPISEVLESRFEVKEVKLRVIEEVKSHKKDEVLKKQLPVLFNKQKWDSKFVNKKFKKSDSKEGFDKKTGKKALICALISIGCFAIWLGYTLLVLNVSMEISLALDTLISVGFMYACGIFALLAILFLIIAFIN